MSFRSVVPLIAVMTASCADVPVPVAPGAIPKGTEAIRGQPGFSLVYLVRFNQDIPDAVAKAQELARAHGGRIKFVYTALKGMAIELPDGAVSALAASQDVVAVVPDDTVSLSATQANPTWGLDRIDERSMPLSGSYTYYTEGTGVRVYIIDTGINPTHVDFGGRASVGVDVTGGNGIDCDGHGTHVAGTAGSSTYGVAKNAQLIGVKVFPGCGRTTTWSDVIAGIDWVTNNAVRPAVANVSLGGSENPEVEAHVQNSIASGITYVVAAGNCDVDEFGNCIAGPWNACTRSPAGASGVITVGATNIDDQFAYFSNYGSCVATNAPGVGILSTYARSNTDVETSNGTSMASPHVAGAAALLLQSNPSWTPATVRSAILSNSTIGKLTGLPAGTPNSLLFSFPALPTTISGPSSMGPGASCTYTSSTSGGVGPYSYSWSWSTYSGGSAGGYSPSNGTFVLVAQSYMDYTIDLRVVATDINGAEGTYTKQVTVSTMMSGCGY